MNATRAAHATQAYGPRQYPRNLYRVARRHTSGRFGPGTCLTVRESRAPRPAGYHFRFLTTRHGLAYARHNQRTIARAARYARMMNTPCCDRCTGPQFHI